MPCSSTYYLEVSACVSLKVATKVSFKGRSYFLKAKREMCGQKCLIVSDKFGMFIPCSTTYFLEVNALVSPESSHQMFF